MVIVKIILKNNKKILMSKNCILQLYYSLNMLAFFLFDIDHVYKCLRQKSA